MVRSLVSVGALSLMLVACVSEVVEPGEGDGDGGSTSTSPPVTTATGTTATTTSGSGGGATTTTTTGGGGTGGSGGGYCEEPSNYSNDCSEVPYFQCGFAYSCDGTTLSVQWHEHIMCYGEEDIVGYACQYACPAGCVEEYQDWPQDGLELIAGACYPEDSASED